MASTPRDPFDIDALLAFHRATFGGTRMEDDSAGTDAGSGDGGSDDPGTDDGAGFPAGTPLAEMTAEQQAAYWKRQSRKHEQQVKALGITPDQLSALRERASQLDALEAASRTDHENALLTAREEADKAARADEQAKILPRLVAAEFRAVAAGRLDSTRIAQVLEPLDMGKFLTDSGEVDAAKVAAYVDGIAPAPQGGRIPDMGQGRRPTSAHPSVSSGAARYAEKHGKTA